MRIRLLLSLAVLAAPPIGAQIGTVLGQHKISSTAGGFAGPLGDYDTFGQALAPLGDLNGDGVVDLAVGAPGDDDGGPYRGAVWILFLDPSGGVRSARKISHTSGFPGVLEDHANFGYSLASLGDMDGDGFQDLAVGAPGVQTVWFCQLRADGSVRLARKTSAGDALYNPPIRGREIFGSALAPLGDIDGNGVVDLAVGCARGGGGPVFEASLWIVRLSPFAAVAGVQQVANGTTGPLAGLEFGRNLTAGDLDGDGDVDLVTSSTPLGPNPNFSLQRLVLDASHNLVSADTVAPGELVLYMGLAQENGIGALELAGDLDGDGGVELFAGAPSWHPGPDSPRRRGGLVTGFLRAIGPARRHALVASHRGGLVGLLPENGGFGSSLTRFGDLDGDGVSELAVGAPGDGDGGTRRGAVWILNLDGSPLRNGSGANPLTLSEVAPPRMAATWHVDLDCSAHAPQLSLLAGYTAGQVGFPSIAGEVLVDPTSVQLFRFIRAHTGGVSRFSMAVPVDAALISLPLHLQGMCAGLPGPRLSNALDEILSVP